MIQLKKKLIQLIGKKECYCNNKLTYRYSEVYDGYFVSLDMDMKETFANMPRAKVNVTIDLINSDKNIGTKITIVLDQKIVKEVSVEDNIINDFKNKKILIIDSNENSVKLIIKILEKYNLKIESTNNIKDCMNLLISNKYSLI